MRLIPGGIEMPDKFGEWVLRRRGWILLFIGLLTTAAAIQVARMPVQTSLLESFIQDPREYNQYRARSRQFGGDSDDLVYIATDEGASLFTAEKFDAIRQVARQLEKMPEVARVTCLTDAYWVKERGQLTAREIINRTVARRQLETGRFRMRGTELGIDKYWPEAQEEQSRVDWSALKEAMLHDERTVGLLLSNDGSTQIMVVQLVTAGELSADAQMRLKDKIVDHVREGRLGKSGVYTAGLLVSQGWMFEEVSRALRVLFPIGLVVICLTVYSLFQRISVVVITAVIGLISILWSIALASLVFGKLSVLVAAAPLVIMVISTSDVIHLATAYKIELGRGLGRDEAIRKVMREVGGACILTSVTTFVGFMSLMAIPAPSTRHLSLAASVGVASALLLAITVVPIAFSFLRPLPIDGEMQFVSVANAAMRRLVSMCRFVSLRYSWTVVFVCIILFVGSLACLPLMHIDIDYARRFKSHHPLRESMDFFNRKLSGSTSVEVFIEGEAGAILDPDNLRAIAQFEEKISKMPEVQAVHSVCMLYRLTDQVVRFGTDDGLPKTRAMAESCFQIFRDIDQQRVNSMVTPGESQLRVTVQLNVSGFLAITNVASRIDDIARRTLPDQLSVDTSGTYPIIGRIVNVMVRSQLVGLATCFLGISVIMAIGMKSLRNAILAQFPNMLPVAMILATLALALPTIDVDMLGLPTVALGIAVDDTIHFLHRYRLQLSKSVNRLEALEKTFTFTGQAILQTTLILCIGLLPFAWGSFLTVWMLGTFLVVTLLLAVLGDLLLLPAMVNVGIIKWRVDAGPSHGAGEGEADLPLIHPRRRVG